MPHLTIYGMLSLILLISVLVNAWEESRSPYWKAWIPIIFGFGADALFRFSGIASMPESGWETLLFCGALLGAIAMLFALVMWAARGMRLQGREMLLGKKHRWLIAVFVLLGVANVYLMNG